MKFEFADSEVAQCTATAQRLELRFSAARVYEDAKTGSGEGVWMPMLLICELYAPSGVELQGIGRLGEGCVRIHGQRLRLLPLPYALNEAHQLELEFANGSRCVAQGQSLQIQPLNPQCAVGSFQC